MRVCYVYTNMLKELSIYNFKSLKNPGKLEIKPITFLVGPNSSGKSSVFHAILALRQTLRNKERKSALILQDYVDLGSFKDIVWGHNSNNNITIKISDSTNNLEFEFAYQENNNSIFLKRFRNFGVDDKGEKDFNFDYEVVKNRNGKYSLKVYNFENFINRDYKIDFYKFYVIKKVFFSENMGMQKIIEKRSKDKKYKLNKNEEKILDKSFSITIDQMALNYFFERQNGNIIKMFDQIYHIGPLRRESQRVYTGSGAFPLEVGKTGEWVVDELISNPETIERVKKWFKDFCIASDFKVQELRKGSKRYEIIIKEFHTGVPINIADVGFGASQILPIIVEGFTSKDSTILIEQPEIHLHPHAQATMGDLLIDITKNGKNNVIVETHSDLIISRICTRIEQGKFNNNDVAVYYFNPTKDGTEIIDVSINNSGQYENFPSGFFEERYDEALGNVPSCE